MPTLLLCYPKIMCILYVFFFLQTSNEQQCVAMVAWVASGAVVELGAEVAWVA